MSQSCAISPLFSGKRIGSNFEGPGQIGTLATYVGWYNSRIIAVMIASGSILNSIERNSMHLLNQMLVLIYIRTYSYAPYY